MEKFLSNLLGENGRVIIPDLGAFIVRQNEPQELVFNDLLSFDDGMLCDHMMQSEKISRSEAQNRIRKFVSQVKDALQQSGSYQLAKLGLLKMDDSSKVEFFSSKSGIITEVSVVEETREEASPEEETIKEEPEKKDTLTEDTVEEKTTDKDLVAEETLVEETVEEKNTDKDLVAEETLVEETVEEKTTDKDLVAEETLVEETVEEKTTDKDLVAEETLVEETVEEKTTDEELVSEDTLVEEAVVEKPVEEAPEEETEAIEPATDEDEFILADTDSDVDIDATKEETPLVADKEEPPFQIDDSDTGEPDGTIEDEESEEVSEPEISDKSEEVSEPEMADKAEEQTEPEREVQDTPDVSSEPGPIKGYEPVNTGSSPFNSYTQGPPPRKRTWPWIVGAVALLIVILAAGWFIFPQQRESIVEKTKAVFNKQAEEKTAIIIGTDASSQEEGAQKSAVTENQVEEITEDQDVLEPASAVVENEEAETAHEQVITVPGPGSKNYYVVAGCFADIKNADNYVATLKTKGFEAFIFGKHKQLHAVCFSYYPDREDAVNELYRIRDTYDDHAWVLYY